MNRAPAPPITAVAFDLGGVLVDWSPRHLYRHLIADDDELDRFMSEVFHREAVLTLDNHASIHDGLAVMAAQFPNDAALIHAYMDNWGKTIAGPIAGSVAVLEEVAATKVPLYAFSNWAAETWPHGLANMPFLDRFDELFISGLEGVAKPQHAYFERALEKFGLTAETTFFVDDHPTNVTAATAIGLRAVQFETAAGLRRDLAACGVLR
jgi:2-haloacid dehalogenase